MLEGVIRLISPSWALQREQSRRILTQLTEFDQARAHRRHQLEDELDRKRAAYYESASPRPGSQQQNHLGFGGDPPNFENITVRDKARAIYRNFAHAQGLVDLLVTRLAPINLFPQSEAILPDGSPDRVFRDRAKKLWDEWGDECLTIGGDDIQQTLQQIARELVITGECLVYYRQWTMAEKRARNLRIGLTLDILESERLNNFVNVFGTQTGTIDNEHASKRIIQGVEIDEYGADLFYHLRRGNPYGWTSLGQWDSEPYPASEFTFVRKRLMPSQFRGISWLQPVMDTLMQIGDLEWNELTASTINSCFAGFIRTLPETNLQAGMARNGGVEGGDKDGFASFPFKTGMFGRLRPGEDVMSFETKRPYSGVGTYIEHLLRSVACAYPIKPSALHGNYIGSTYSSEASAEIENLQRREAAAGFFCNNVAEKIFERVVLRAMLEGYFDGYMVKTELDPWERKLTVASWPQVQVRSINPQNDIKASLMRVFSGMSSIKREAQLWGTDWRENIKDLAEFLAQCDEEGLPEAFVLKMFDIATAPIITQEQQEPQQNPQLSA